MSDRVLKSRFNRCAFERIAAALIAGASLLGAAQAQLSPADRDCDEPFDVGSERLEVIDNLGVWTGNVRVVQCDAILVTDRLDVYLDDNNNAERFVAVGKVRFTSGADVVASDRALYDAVAGSITFSENVVVTQDKQVMTGGVLTYWTETGQIDFSAPQGQRVRGIFHTKSLNPS